MSILKALLSAIGLADFLARWQRDKEIKQEGRVEQQAAADAQTIKEDARARQIESGNAAIDADDELNRRLRATLTSAGRK